MKKAILPTICILMCTLCILFVPTEHDAAIYDDTVRVHILAPSDSIEDQTLKLKIRDMLLENYGSRLHSSEHSEAWDEINNSLMEIQRDCEELIFNTGRDYSVSVQLVREWYSTRDYKSFTLPSGYYDSLKITLGEGAGQNWWCVMYPPLCLDAAISENSSNYSEEEYLLITKDGYRVKFKLLELASELIPDK